MRILGIIPARGGSKGVPNKNIKLLESKPLLQYTWEAAKEVKSLHRIIVSTEDDKIISISKNCIDDNILANEIKIIARAYIKKKIGLKPSTIVEIIRI